MPLEMTDLRIQREESSYRTSIFRLFRSFLWLVAELAKVWDSQVELAGSMVGDGSEVDEVFESPGHSLC
jgi:hypothetical protein